MLERTKKRPTDTAEIRFIGKAEEIRKLRHCAEKYDLVEVTPELELEIAMVAGGTTSRAEEVFPELMTNRAGVAIRGYRSREGLTQKQLAAMTGIAQHHISAMENGKCSIGKDRAKKLAATLHCDYRRFL